MHLYADTSSSVDVLPDLDKCHNGTLEQYENLRSKFIQVFILSEFLSVEEYVGFSFSNIYTNLSFDPCTTFDLGYCSRVPKFNLILLDEWVNS